jgi:hypothetical protein
MALAREWESLVEQVRGVEGFEDFLRPPSVTTLQRAAAAGPVVVVNVSRWRCDALIVTTGAVEVVELPDLTADDVARRTTAYLQALQYDPKPTSGLPFLEALKLRATISEERDATLRATMRWLWDTIAEPVLTALGFTDPPADDAWPRLCWCPTGLLTLLPLHGAGHHELDGTAAGGRVVIDRVVSSYTATLRALGEPTRTAPPESTDKLLFIGVPDVPDQLQMADDVEREREFLAALFPTGVHVVEGGEATVGTVENELRDHRYVHISCHGWQDLADPTAAGLVLSDGLLTITRISATAFPGEFVFLSACKTATGGLQLPDEVITLAAALNYAGFRHVVATLWSVDPRVAAEVTESLYPQLISGSAFFPADAARALHHSVRLLRAAGAQLEDWLPFIHNGS